MINVNDCGVIGVAPTRGARGVYVGTVTQHVVAVGQHITHAAAVAPGKTAAIPRRRPNPAVKRTNTGGAHRCTHRTSSAPLFAAYLRR